jgi:SP family sugar:H+ symporter-like MFS transporter
MYQSETAPKWIRGTIVGAYQLAITIGLFLAAIVNNSTKDRNDPGSYRIPIAVQFLWSLILIIGSALDQYCVASRLTTVCSLIFLPETPRYLIKMNKYNQAARSLAKLRRLPVRHAAIGKELNEVQANHLYEMSLGKSSYIECFKGTLGRRLLTGCLLQALQQLTGVNFICKSPTAHLKLMSDSSQSTTERSISRTRASRTHSSSRSSPTPLMLPPHSLVCGWSKNSVAATSFFSEPLACVCVSSS